MAGMALSRNFLISKSTTFFSLFKNSYYFLLLIFFRETSVQMISTTPGIIPLESHVVKVGRSQGLIRVVVKKKYKNRWCYCFRTIRKLKFWTTISRKIEVYEQQQCSTFFILYLNSFPWGFFFYVFLDFIANNIDVFRALLCIVNRDFWLVIYFHDGVLTWENNIYFLQTEIFIWKVVLRSFFLEWNKGKNIWINFSSQDFSVECIFIYMDVG
jgi:hypothetical protein